MMDGVFPGGCGFCTRIWPWVGCTQERRKLTMINISTAQVDLIKSKDKCLNAGLLMPSELDKYGLSPYFALGGLHKRFCPKY